MTKTSLVHLSEHDLQALVRRALLHAGAGNRVAAIIAANCVACERDGSKSHGIFRVPGYVASIKTGWVDAKASPIVEDCAPGMVRVDAANGFAQVALEDARSLLLAKAADAGVAVLAIRNSHHLSALWPDVEPFAQAGYIALSVVNSFACVVPHGGRRAVLGTNPIAYAVPHDNPGPIVVDLATSAIPNGDVQLAAATGAQLPEGVAVDGKGLPTRDPRIVLSEGALLTFGGHKGSALSILVELLAAGLAGGDFSYEVDWTGFPAAQTPRTAQTVIVIDPSRGHPGSFGDRVQALVEQLRDAGLSQLPGERRYVARAAAGQSGIAVEAETLEMLDRLATL